MLTIHDTRPDFAARACSTAVLPIGAVEQHGRHLPIGTDIIFAEAVAERVAAELDAFLLPPIAISASIEHRKAAPELSPAQHGQIFEHASGDIHAGEYETSLMLHLHPEHVRPLDPAPATAAAFPPHPYLDYFDATELTPDGHWGWPHAATAEKGRRALEQLVASSLRYIEEIEAAAKRIEARTARENP